MIPLSPSLVEQPLYRLRFRDPEGNLQQSTVWCSWPLSCRPAHYTPCKTRLSTVGETLLALTRSNVESLGCTFLGLELIATEVLEVPC